MKLLAAPKYVSDAVAPLVILNYLTGLRIFEYPRGKLHTVPSLIYLLLLLGIFCITVHVQYSFFKQKKLLKLQHALYDFMIYICSSFITHRMILGYFYTKTVNECYRKSAQIDDTLQRLGSIINYSKIYFLSIGIAVVWFSFVISLVIMTPFHLHADLPSVICIIVAQIYLINVNFIIPCEFLIFVRYLQTRFKLVNELLSGGAAVSTTDGIKLFSTENYVKITDSQQRQNILSIKVMSKVNQQLQTRIRTSVFGKRNSVRLRTRSRLSPQLQNQFQMELQKQSRNQFGDSNLIRKSVEEYRRRIHLLQTIRHVHLELCRILKMLCTSFGIQIVSEIGLATLLLSLFFYNLYILVQQKQRAAANGMIDEVSTTLMLIVIQVLKIVFINRICKHATNEGKKTCEIIHEIYGCCQDADIREEVQQFGLQILWNPVEFFIFGMSLNYQVLTSSLNTVTTYLVIMIQMSDSLESSKNN